MGNRPGPLRKQAIVFFNTPWSTRRGSSTEVRIWNSNRLIISLLSRVKPQTLTETSDVIREHTTTYSLAKGSEPESHCAIASSSWFAGNTGQRKTAELHPKCAISKLQTVGNSMGQVACTHSSHRPASHCSTLTVTHLCSSALATHSRSWSTLVTLCYSRANSRLPTRLSFPNWCISH